MKMKPCGIQSSANVSVMERFAQLTNTLTPKLAAASALHATVVKNSSTKGLANACVRPKIAAKS